MGTQTMEMAEIYTELLRIEGMARLMLMNSETMGILIMVTDEMIIEGMNIEGMALLTITILSSEMMPIRILVMDEILYELLSIDQMG